MPPIGDMRAGVDLRRTCFSLASGGPDSARRVRTSRIFQEALGKRDFSSLRARGFEPMLGLGPEQSRTFVRDEYLRWEQVIRSADI